ncbi:MAG: hypothetical protein ED558_04140 [Oricola sp.]|nr:MAG: hypothetical protein ED558_04140 [Oricola sp.]
MKRPVLLFPLLIALPALAACNENPMSASSDAEAAFESVVQMFVEHSEVREQVLEECAVSPNEMMAIDCEAAAEARRRAFRGDGQAYEPADDAPELFPNLDDQTPPWARDDDGSSGNTETEPPVDRE